MKKDLFDLAVMTRPVSVNGLQVNHLSRTSGICDRVPPGMNTIIFRLSGMKPVRINRDSLSVAEGEGVFLSADACNGFQQISINGETDLLTFCFDQRFIAETSGEFARQFSVSHEYQHTEEQKFRIHVNPHILVNFYGILPLLTGEIRYSENLLERRTRDLLISILADPANAAILGHFRAVYANDHNPLSKVMESNFMCNLSVNEFARLCKRSKSSFKNDFRKFYKTSPGKWLLERRLAHARKLLESTSQNITEIADNSGFENISHFSRVFKEKFGNTPSDLRKKVYQPVL